MLVFILCFLILILVIGLYQKNTNAVCKSKKRLEGKTALVTGGTLGMGLEIALDFAHRGAKVIIACPFQAEGTNAELLIVRSSRNKQVIFKHLDLASLQSVRDFAADIISNEERLDILVNNAGFSTKNSKLTADGFNDIMQVNYFGHFLLTLLLLPLLKKSGTANEPSRIVNTSSITRYLTKPDLKDLNKLHCGIVDYTYFNIGIYGRSKLCLLLFTQELAKKLSDSHVVVNAIDPGAIGTNILSGYDITGYLLSKYFYYFFKTPWQGCQTCLYACLSRSAGTRNGEIFVNCKFVRPYLNSIYDHKFTKALWDESVKLTGYNPGLVAN